MKRLPNDVLGRDSEDKRRLIPHCSSRSLHSGASFYNLQSSTIFTLTWFFTTYLHCKLQHIATTMADQHVPRANKTLPGHGNTSSHEDTAARSKALNQKLDVALLPLLSLLYLFNGLDRGNVGNAETQGLPPQYLTLQAELTNIRQVSPRTLVPNPMTSTKLSRSFL